MEADDVLADDMHIGRPVLPVRLALVREADAGDVVGQRVEPDIHHVLGVVRHLHAPIEGGARDRQILQPRLDEADDFVATRVRTDEVRLLLVELQQAGPDRPTGGRNSSARRPIRPACLAGRGGHRPRRRWSHSRRSRPRRGPSTSPNRRSDRCRRTAAPGSKAPGSNDDAALRWCG